MVQRNTRVVFLVNFRRILPAINVRQQVERKRIELGPLGMKKGFTFEDSTAGGGSQDLVDDLAEEG
jgi:hypothetical protein